MDISVILEQIKETNANSSFFAWSATLQKNVSLIGFNTGHQQTFVQNMLDSPYLNAPFIISLAKFIAESWNDETDFDPKTLTVQDKASFVIQLWLHSYNTDRTEKIRENYSGPIQPPSEEKMISHGEYSAVLNFPSILKEAFYAKYMQEWTQENLKENSPSGISALNSLFYLLEPLVYIQKLKIRDVEFNMDDYTVADQISIGQKLPLTFIKEVNDIISSYYVPILNEIKTVSIDGTETVLNLNNSDFIIVD